MEQAQSRPTLLDLIREHQKLQKIRRPKYRKIFLETVMCRCGFEMAYKAVRCPACGAPLPEASQNQNR